MAAGYGAFAEILSWFPAVSPCVVVSQYQAANDRTGYQSCAALHEGLIRLFWFLADYINHDNVIAFGTVMIAIFTWTLWRSTYKLWKAGEAQLAHAENIEADARTRRWRERLIITEQIEIARQTAEAAKKSAETAEKALLAANNPIITITELELRDPNDRANMHHIHWALRNSGNGFGVVHTMFTRTVIGIKTVSGVKLIRSKEQVNWGSSIEPSTTVPGFSISTPVLQERISDIRSGKATLGFAIQVNGQNLFKDRFSVIFTFQFDHATDSFHRVPGSFEEEAEA